MRSTKWARAKPRRRSLPRVKGQTRQRRRTHATTKCSVGSFRLARAGLDDYRALLKTPGIQHVSLRVSGCRSDSALTGGGVFCSRCEAEIGDLQVRCGPAATASRGARCFSQEMHGGQGRSARPTACRSRHCAQAIVGKPRATGSGHGRPTRPGYRPHRRFQPLWTVVGCFIRCSP